MTNTNVTTGKVRLSFVNLFEPKEPINGGTPKYSTTILIPKSDTATKERLDSAIKAAAELAKDSKWGGTIPPQYRTPIHDGDGGRPSDGEPYGDECKGHWVITASAGQDFRPQVVDQALNPILDKSEVYSGCYARVNLNFYAYGGGSTGFAKGVGVGLGPVQKIADGEALGGGAVKAEDVFKAVEVDPITGEPI